MTWRALLVRVVAALAITLCLALIGLPVLALLLRVPAGTLLARLADPLVLSAVRLSLVTSVAAAALIVVLGTPVAWLLATREFHGKRILEAVIDLPMVLPPTAAGVGLLLAFGRAGLVGRALASFGISLPFSTAAVVMAEAFVALPFFVGAAAAGFREVEPRYLDAAATLRASPGTTFFRVMLPLALPSVLAGATMSWARALGEFGATITFAGNLPGVTQTMPLAVYIALETDLEAAVALSVLLVLLSLTVLVAVRALPLGPAALRHARRDPR
ncbi:MAG TPA: ABC transporter permease [Gemmatimonadales bacterium]|jgi:molybdate transport system permease protein|nr:ABC transporter permease [Gemmatimonadales bacterium]